MDYKLLYIDDQDCDSRASDFSNSGFSVDIFDPTENLKAIIDKIDELSPDILVLDYKLTRGDGNAFYDAPTIAQTLRTAKKNIPIVLISNQNYYVESYKKDKTSHDLFDFTFKKGDLINDMTYFKKKSIAFIQSYETIRNNNFDLTQILNEQELSSHLQSILLNKLNGIQNDIFFYCSSIFSNLIRSQGALIDENILSARLGVSKASKDWDQLKEKLNTTIYSGIFSEVYSRWWMNKITIWWENTVKCKSPLRRLNAEERVEILVKELKLNLEPIEKAKFSKSSNFWTVCKHSKVPIDPFDGVELMKDYKPWQDKEYLSLESAIIRMDDYKEQISNIDKQAIKELVNSY